MSGLDRSFELASKIKGYFPVQMATLFFSNDSESDFTYHVSELIRIINDYKQKFNTKEGIQYTTPDKLKYIQMSVNSIHRRIDFYVNHKNLGGPDYINIAKMILNCDFNELARDEIATPIKWLYSMSFIMKSWKLYNKPENICVPTTTIIYKMPVPRQKNIKTKYVLIHRLLTQTINASMREELICWIPLSFERTNNNNAINNLGVLTVTFKRHMSVSKFAELIENNAHTPIGSKNLLDSLVGESDVGQEKSLSLKKRVDVVLSMFNTKSTGIKRTIDPNIISVYFGKEMQVDYTYPVYIFTITIDDIVHVTNSIGVADINTSELCRSVNGKILI